MKYSLNSVVHICCLIGVFFLGCEEIAQVDPEFHTTTNIMPATVGDNVTFTTHHSDDAHGFDDQIATDDLIAGMIATELPGDMGWHAANTNPLDQLPAFTDGEGLLASGLTGLLNDFPGSGTPAKRLQFDLAEPSVISEIRVLTGNQGADGRVFSTFTVYYSTDGGTDFELLGYFQSDPSGTVNNISWRSTLVTVYDEVSLTLVSDVTNLRFDFYSVDNTAGEMRDPFDGVNPFTGVDDGLSAPFVSPLVWEIDVIGGTPETIGSVLETLDETIEELPDDVFASAAPGHRTAMQSRLQAIRNGIDNENYAQALRNLQNLRRHVDGCGDDADSNDWIVDCDAQLEVRGLIDALITLVMAEIAG